MNWGFDNPVSTEMAASPGAMATVAVGRWWWLAVAAMECTTGLAPIK